MPWKFVRDLWFHKDFTNNNLQADNKRNERFNSFHYLLEDCCL